MELGGRILELRKKAGMSQEELADRLGVSRQAVGKWENGAAMPDITNLVELSRVFGVKLGELLGLEEAYTAGSEADEEIQKLLEQYLQDQRDKEEDRQKKEETRLEEERERQGTHRKILLAAGAVVLCLGILAGVKIANLEQRMEDMNARTSAYFSSLESRLEQTSHDIYRVEESLTERLNEQNSIFIDKGIVPLSYDGATGDTEFQIWASPRSLEADMTLT